MVKVLQSKILNSNLAKVKLREFVNLRAKHKKKSQEEIGSLGGATDAFLEKHGLNKVGLGIFNRLNEMSAYNRADALRTFDICRGHFADDWSKQAEMELEEQAEGKKEKVA